MSDEPPAKKLRTSPPSPPSAAPAAPAAPPPTGASAISNSLATPTPVALLTDTNTSSSRPPSKAAQQFGFDKETGLFGSLVPSLGLRASTEPEVGIEEYVDPELPPFEGIIKHRFTDFLVFEVGLDNQVVRLKNLACPRSAPPPTAPPAPTTSAEGSVELWNDTSAGLMKSILGEEKIGAFEEFVKAGPPTVVKGKVVGEAPKFRSDPVADKTERGAFHKTLREAFGGKIVSETKDLEGGVQVIDIAWKTPGGKKERVSKAECEVQHPPFIHFTLLKTNRETHDALSSLSRSLYLQPRDIGTAGTKDKRAVTVQRVSVKRGGKTMEDVWRAANGKGKGRFAERGVKVGDFEYSEKGLELGMLKGNKFVVTLRDVNSPLPSTIPLAIESLSKKGFINYYGMQRFGTAPIPTHAIGLAVLRGDWKLAVELILSEREGENEDAQEARKLWHEGKVGEALRAMPRRCVAERAVLEYLSRQRQDSYDYLAALSRIPKNLRMMYVHAWQSYIFNQVVSERVRLFGASKPVAGDLVYVDREAGAATAEEEEVVEEAPKVEEKVESLDADLDEEAPSDSAPRNHRAGGFDATTALATSRVAKARALTQEDIEAGTYTVFDVVLPLPGYAVIYPEGALGESYRRIMRADGIDPDDLFRKQKEYSLGGTYRTLLHLPSDVTHRMLLYTSTTQDLAQSDEDILNKVALPPTTPYDPSIPIPEGHSLALQIELTLGAGTFATMALREVLKSRTGAAHQKALTAGMEERFKVKAVAEEVQGAAAPMSVAEA